MDGSTHAYNKIQTSYHYTIAVNSAGEFARFSSTEREFRAGNNAIYYPWVANDDDFGLDALRGRPDAVAEAEHHQPLPPERQGDHHAVGSAGARGASVERRGVLVEFAHVDVVRRVAVVVAAVPVLPDGQVDRVATY